MGKKFWSGAACFQHNGLEMICQFSGIFILKIVGNNTDTQKSGRRPKVQILSLRPFIKSGKRGAIKAPLFLCFL